MFWERGSEVPITALSSVVSQDILFDAVHVPAPYFIAMGFDFCCCQIYISWSWVTGRHYNLVSLQEKKMIPNPNLMFSYVFQGRCDFRFFTELTGKEVTIEWCYGWKTSCTTWDIFSPVNTRTRINYRSSGAGFLPSTVLEYDWVGSCFDPTPWKTNMEPENHPVEKKNHLPNLHCWVLSCAHVSPEMPRLSSFVLLPWPSKLPILFRMKCQMPPQIWIIWIHILNGIWMYLIHFASSKSGYPWYPKMDLKISLIS